MWWFFYATIYANIVDLFQSYWHLYVHYFNLNHNSEPLSNDILPHRNDWWTGRGYRTWLRPPRSPGRFGTGMRSQCPANGSLRLQSWFERLISMKIIVLQLVWIAKMYSPLKVLLRIYRNYKIRFPIKILKRFLGICFV